MGLFSSIFGSGGSDKADKARQAALDAFNSIKTPELSALQVQLDKYVQAGQLTPEQAETQLLGSNAFNAIVTDPSYVGAQKQALQQMQAIATQGGMTAIDKAQLQDITDQQNQQNQSQNAATMQQSQQRGVGGSDLTAVNQLINEQGNADRASAAGVNVAANAQQRALQAMQAAGTTGANLESQAYGEAANKANAANAIDVFNKNALNQTNLYNTQTANAAQGTNLANAQAINNANTASGNANKEYNAEQNQTVYNDELAKANGIAGVDTSIANQANKQAEDERNASAGLVSGALQAGGSALAGPLGGAAVSAMNSTPSSTTSGYAPPSYAPKNENDIGFGYSEGGEVTDPEHPDHMANGGHVHCYSHGGQAYHHPECMAQGGDVESSTEPVHADIVVEKDSKKPTDENFVQKMLALLGSHADAANKVDMESDGGKIDYREGGTVPGRAKVKGDSPENDTVDAKLSPGEVVVPRSAVNDEEDFKKFMAKFQQHKSAGGKVTPVPAVSLPRVNDANPMRNTVHAPKGNPVPLAATNDANDFSQMMHKFAPKKVHKFDVGGPVQPMQSTDNVPPLSNPVLPPSMPMAPVHKSKKPKPPTQTIQVTPEARALANLHHRISHLEKGGPK